MAKQCIRCKEWLLLDEFHKNRKAKDGLQGICKLCANKASAIYRQQNRDHLLELQRNWNKENSERLKAYKTQQYRTRRDEICARERARYRRITTANPEKYRVRSQNRRAQIIGNGGVYTEEEWLALCTKYGNICLWCHRKTKLTVDHVVPISRGGTNDIGNIQPLCLHCNLEKSDKIMDFRKYHDLFITTTETLETE